MLPENMPRGYRQPRTAKASTVIARDITEVTDDTAISLATSIYKHDSNGHASHLRHVPVVFESFSPDFDRANLNVKPRHNSELVLAAHTLLQFTWAVYCFNSGHFTSCFEHDNLPFRVTLAADPSVAGRSCFRRFTTCGTILSGLQELLHHVRSSGDSSALDGYLLHAHNLHDSKSRKEFWQLQASLVVQLRTIRSLSLFVAFIPPHHDKQCVSTFISIVTNDSWVISDTVAQLSAHGDSIASSSRVVIGVHSLTASHVKPLHLPTPPILHAPPLATYIWSPFNVRQYALSYTKDSPQFDTSINDQNSPSCLRHSAPLFTSDSVTTPNVLYCLHNQDQDGSIQAGSEVVSLAHLSPPLCLEHTGNLFGNYYGVKFRCDNDTFVRAISPFKFTRLFELSDDLTYHLSHLAHQPLLEHGMPCRTSSFVFNICHDKLCAIREANVQLFDPSNH
eukprot:scaffold40342_cov40-Cyclotella_meneghiniana.AAC.1